MGFWRGGILAAAGEELVHISMSTISTALSRRLEAARAERGQGYVGAPVFGRLGWFGESDRRRRGIEVGIGDSGEEDGQAIFASYLPNALEEAYCPLFDCIVRYRK